MIHAAPDPVSLLALGLTALLALRGEQADMVRAALLLPAWLPLASLAVFAAACGVLGVRDPETLAAVFGVI